MYSTHPHNQPLNRRSFLTQVGGGFGGLAALDLLARSGKCGDLSLPSAELNGGLHHPAKVRRVIQLFMNGGVSQMDTFDYKPVLHEQHGQKRDFGIKTAVTSEPGALMKSPFEFKQHGESGRWVSSVFPHLANHVDDLAFLMAMKSQTNVHGPASYLQNTGFLNPGFPCMGALLNYGLGSLTDDLPSFVVLPDHRGFPYNNTGNFSAGFLPAANSATIIKPQSKTPVPNLHPPQSAKQITSQSESDGLELLALLNRKHQSTRES